ncbi:MAG: FAD-dependent pyridine nucleotide-disulfide oxidoreductase [Gemmatimonadetes bacterium]|nr:FAD-dependent pyridine nucleotide-disulfide oxidoreductase [Gemmatimonadota bacterium]
MTAARPHVVIVGGGFAGLQAAKGLSRLPVQVTVVDRTNHHLFQPLLYQVAMAALNPADIAQPIRSILRQGRNTEVLLAEAARVDAGTRQLHLTDGAVLEYDYLILAPGVRHSYFGKPAWEQLAPGLKTVEDALEIRRRVLLAFERAERATTPEERHRLLTFVVVGGGPTGVEVAGALAEIKRYALTRDFRHIDPRDATVVLLEGGPRLLPSYPGNLSQKAKETLRELGVDVRIDSMVTGMEEGAVASVGWRIPTDTVVWAAGSVGNPLLATVGAPLDRIGRVVVDPDCAVPGHPEILVLGDGAAYTHDPRFETLPGIAPVAIQQGRYVAEAIRADLAGRARRPFRYVDKGQLAVIGRGRAVADIGPIRTSGFLAWLTWVFIHIFYLIGFANRVVVLIQWAISYVTFKRGARLITRSWRPAGPPPA